MKTLSEHLLAFLEWYDSNVCQNDCRSREELVKDFLKSNGTKEKITPKP